MHVSYMLPEKVAQWVAALRSGNYTQCAGMFQNMNGSYCALGVYHAQDPSVVWNTRINKLLNPFTGSMQEIHHKVPARRAGKQTYETVPGAPQTSGNPQVWYDGTLHSIPYLNDIEHLTFKQIADLIEDQCQDPEPNNFTEARTKTLDVPSSNASLTLT